MPIDPPADAADLARQLDEVTRRDAEFRLKTIHLFRELDGQLRQTRDRMEALSLELGERNTYIHQLHLERVERQRVLAATHEDLASYSQWLAAAEDQAAALRRELQRVKGSWSWRYGAWLRQLQRWLRPTHAAAVPEAEPALMDPNLVYYLHTSPFRVFRSTTATLRGWVYHQGSAPLTAVRARLGGAEFIGRNGLEEPEAALAHGLAGGPQERPGFEIHLTLTAGRHTLSLEAQVGHREWRPFLITPIWVRP